MAASNQAIVGSIKQSDLFLAKTENVYKPLNTSKREINLMHILPGDFNDEPIQLTLEVVSLDDSPDYESVSYAWDNNGETKEVLLEGVPYRVTPNQHAALKKFRSREQDRVMWMDCICINQTDLAERARQIRILADVYRKARALQIWLGEDLGDSDEGGLDRDAEREEGAKDDEEEEETDEDEVGEENGDEKHCKMDDEEEQNENERVFQRYLDVFKRGYELKYPEGSEHDEVPLNLDFRLMKRGDKVSAAVHALMVLALASKSHPLPLKTLCKRSNAFSWYRALRALGSVLSLSWWKRAWVFQEIVLSINAQVELTAHLGSKTIPFSMVVRLCQFWDMNSRSTPDYFDVAVPFFSEHALASCIDYTVHQSTRYQSDGGLDWYSCWLVTRRLSATDPHDSVHSFLGLLNPSVGSIDADYTRPVRETFALATWTAFRSSSYTPYSCDIMLSAFRKKNDPFRLPSWCVDWTTIESGTVSSPGPYPFDFFPYAPQANSALTTPPDAVAGFLLLSAVEIDVISVASARVEEQVEERQTEDVKEHEEILCMYRNFLRDQSIQLPPDEWRRLIFMDALFPVKHCNGRLDRAAMDLIASWELHSVGCDDHECALHEEVRHAFRDCSYGRRMFSTQAKHVGIGHGNLQKGDKLFRIVGFGGIYVFRPVQPEVNSTRIEVPESTGETYQLIGNGYVSNWRSAVDGNLEEKIIRLV